MGGVVHADAHHRAGPGDRCADPEVLRIADRTQLSRREGLADALDASRGEKLAVDVLGHRAQIQVAALMQQRGPLGPGRSQSSELHNVRAILRLSDPHYSK